MEDLLMSSYLLRFGVASGLTAIGGYLAQPELFYTDGHMRPWSFITKGTSGPNGNVVGGKPTSVKPTVLSLPVASILVGVIFITFL